MSDQVEHHQSPIKTPRQLITVVVLAFVVPVILIILLATYVTGSSTSPAGSDAMTPEAIADLTVAAMIAVAALFGAGCAVTSGQSSAGEYVDDATITTRVKTKFAEDKTVAASRIQVETLKGVVQLSGFATSEAERQRAAQLAAAVPGVKQVHNSIEVRAPQS
jgi:hypothetical protein